MVRFCELIDVYRAINSFEQRFLVQSNLCLNEAMILCLLNSKKNMHTGQIVEKLALPPPHISKLLKSLEDKGFIIREIDKTDKRKMCFFVSKIGLEKLEEIKPFSEEFAQLLSQSIKYNYEPVVHL